MKDRLVGVLYRGLMVSYAIGGGGEGVQLHLFRICQISGTISGDGTKFLRVAEKVLGYRGQPREFPSTVLTRARAKNF